MAEMVKDPSQRVMYVTMGTSLFHSATWEPNEEVCKLVSGYEEWTGEETRSSPSSRQASPHAASIRERLGYALRTNNAERWAKWLSADLLAGRPSTGSLLRYSAELTTLLKLAETRPAGQTLADFLNGYGEIRFVYDDRSPASGGPNLPQIAASHLACYLNVLAGQEKRAGLVAVPGLSSQNPDEVLEGIQGFGDEIAKAIEQFRWFDFIASGGYKLYGTLLADLRDIPSISARLIYLHEEGQGIFVSPKEEREPLPPQGDDQERIRKRAADFGRY
jgi:hypothetical protein